MENISATGNRINNERGGMTVLEVYLNDYADGKISLYDVIPYLLVCFNEVK